MDQHKPLGSFSRGTMLPSISPPESHPKTLKKSVNLDTFEEEDCVGELDEAQQLGGVGVAPANASPESTVDISSRRRHSSTSPRTSSGTQWQSNTCSSRDLGHSSAKSSNWGAMKSCVSSSSGSAVHSPLLSGVKSATHLGASQAPERSAAFEDYKGGPGKKTAELLAENKSRLRAVGSFIGQQCMHSGR